MNMLRMVYMGLIKRIGLYLIRDVFPTILILLMVLSFMNFQEIVNLLLILIGSVCVVCLIVSIAMVLRGLKIYKSISLALLNIVTTFKYLYSDDKRDIQSITKISENYVEVKVDKGWCISSLYDMAGLDNIIAIIIVHSLKERIGDKGNIQWLMTTKIDRVKFEKDEQGFINKINFQLS